MFNILHFTILLQGMLVKFLLSIGCFQQNVRIYVNIYTKDITCQGRWIDQICMNTFLFLLINYFMLLFLHRNKLKFRENGAL